MAKKPLFVLIKHMKLCFFSSKVNVTSQIKGLIEVFLSFRVDFCFMQMFESVDTRCKFEHKESRRRIFEQKTQNAQCHEYLSALISVQLSYVSSGADVTATFSFGASLPVAPSSVSTAAAAPSTSSFFFS